VSVLNFDTWIFASGGIHFGADIFSFSLFGYVSKTEDHLKSSTTMSTHTNWQ